MPTTKATCHNRPAPAPRPSITPVSATKKVSHVDVIQGRRDNADNVIESRAAADAAFMATADPSTHPDIESPGHAGDAVTQPCLPLPLPTPTTPIDR